LEEVRVRDRVEVSRQIGIHDVGIAPADQPVRFLDGIDRAAAWSVAIALLWHFFQRAEREAGSADRTSQLHDLRELIQQSGADGRQAGLRRWSTSFSFFPAWRL
jgi:hypothetical protein